MLVVKSLLRSRTITLPPSILWTTPSSGAACSFKSTNTTQPIVNILLASTKLLCLVTGVSCTDGDPNFQGVMKSLGDNNNLLFSSKYVMALRMLAAAANLVSNYDNSTGDCWGPGNPNKTCRTILLAIATFHSQTLRN